MANLPKVIIVGVGFGGLYAAKKLANKPVDVLLIDRQNFHLFSPLLYQVASSGLESGEIASPIRGIFHKAFNINFMLGDVQKIDPTARTVQVKIDQQIRTESYDYLIVAAGSETHYFGIEAVREYSFALKTLSDGIILRNHLLKCFEKAAWTTGDPSHREALTTILIVGGGPTGIELAGAIEELCMHILNKEYDHGPVDLEGRVILVELLDHLLDPYPRRLQKAARRQLESLGVEVLLGDSVVDAADGIVTLKSGRKIPSYTLIWAAGVQASPVGNLLGIPAQKNGRIPIKRSIEAVGLEDVYIVGDLAYLEDNKGQPYPMLIPVAKQQGMLAAENILRRLNGQLPKTFKYRDRGIMATIGRRRAVAWIYYKVQLTGFLAWLSWLGLHLIALIGFRNRLNVLINWTWNYFTYDRSIRMILEHRPHQIDQLIFAEDGRDRPVERSRP